ncbi:alpha/beta fold hydrolase [Acidipila sp. EB88]|uniref:alpha/beta fold hydrolase n=1 Tax=Acidipila sp. EB88 TaxID=2305226 RepID=UPI001F1DDB78|nr:alpha/beta hydrolase [Acidipila sp. EB88]
MCSATVIALLACAPLHATAQIHSTPPPLIHNIVLVHGAWADGTSWSKVVPLLEAEGFHVTAVHLPFTTLAEDAAAVARVLKLQDGPVLLVGHSYGGAVITEAGDDPKVTRLVYVDAFAPDLGQSVSDLVHQDAGPSGGKEIRPDASGFLTLTAQGVMQDFAQDLTVSEQHLITATQGQVSGPDELGAKLTRVAWKQKPTFYVVADDDRMIGPALENRFATQMHATQIHIASGHLVMLSHPVQVAEFIAAAANTAK